MKNDKTHLLFGKENLLLFVLSLLLIFLGFILMKGGGSVDGIAFSDSIFSFKRIVLAPAVCLLGFILMIFAIMIRPKNKK